jgi:hypothetical protein
VELAIQVELIALGVTTEVVVVVQDQHARAGTRFAIEIRGGQSADAAADDYEIVDLARLFEAGGRGPEVAVPEMVGCLERPGVAPPHAGEQGWVIAGPVLWPDQRFARPGSARPSGPDRTNSNRDPIEEVAPIDGAVQAKGFIAGARVSGHASSL